MSLESPRELFRASASGWWQPTGGEREALWGIQFFIYTDTISGSGYDSRGCFALSSEYLPDGTFSMRKHYGRIPGADMLGQTDGEGNLWGTWVSQGQTGEWFIHIDGPLVIGKDKSRTIKIVDISAQISDITSLNKPRKLP